MNSRKTRSIPPHFLKFVTTKYNYAARNYYDEYLFDQDGELAFAYIYDPMWAPDENTNDQEYEFRFYYNKGKLLQAIVKNKPYDQQASFKEVYSGASPNGAFKSKVDYTLQWCGKYRQMFQSIDNLTYDSSY